MFYGRTITGIPGEEAWVIGAVVRKKATARHTGLTSASGGPDEPDIRRAVAAVRGGSGGGGVGRVVGEDALARHTGGAGLEVVRDSRGALNAKGGCGGIAIVRRP